MSDMTAEYLEFDVETAFISLRLKWTLKAEELRSISSNKVSAVNSDLYKFEDINNLIFFLCLEYEEAYSRCHYELSVRGYKMWSLQVLNHFILTKDRAYSLRPFNQNAFLDGFNDGCLSDEEENVEVHCVIRLWPMCSVPQDKNESSLVDGQRIIGIDSIPCPSLPDGYENENVISFIQEGEIPRLTVERALQIISETETHENLVIKILYMEYLMKNIYAENLQRILEAAIEFELPCLERCCKEYR